MALKIYSAEQGEAKKQGYLRLVKDEEGGIDLDLVDEDGEFEQHLLYVRRNGTFFRPTLDPTTAKEYGIPINAHNQWKEG